MDWDEMENSLPENWRLAKIFSEKEGGLFFKDYNGHFRQGASWEKKCYWEALPKRNTQLLAELYFVPGTPEETQALKQAFETGESLPKPHPLGAPSGFQCPYCARRLKIGFDGVSLYILGEACPTPEGIPYTEFELNVPSGKIAVDDDLRQWFPINGDPDINTLLGRAQWTQLFAATGLALGSIGNSCPDIRRNGKNKFVIANYSDEVYNSETQEASSNPEPCPWGKKVASVCTDLWAYSIADVDELQRRMDHYTPGETVEKWSKHWTHKIVKVKPGVYRFRHYHERDEDAGSVLFADFEWVREPDPLTDYLGLDKELNNNALECLVQNAIRWPTLYLPSNSKDYDDRKKWADLSLAQKVSTLARTADHFMCVLGGGVEWHENGFPRGDVSPEVRRLAQEFAEELGLGPGTVPSLSDLSWMNQYSQDIKEDLGESTSFHWYPISAGYGGLCLGAGVGTDKEYKPCFRDEIKIPLNRSFVLLGLNICQNMLCFPAKPEINNRVYPPVFQREVVRERLKLALMCYQGLRKNYPEIVFDPEFDARVSAGVVPAYIQSLDLGPPNPPEETWGPVPAALQVQSKYVEFDASQIKDEGHFCWHPRNPGVAGCWARKEDAQRYAIETQSPGVSVEGLGFWSAHAPTSVPLKFVARVIRPDQASNIGPLVVVEFDYGSDHMSGAGKKTWALRDGDLKACRFFDADEEYQALQETCRVAFEQEEAAIEAKRVAYAAEVSRLQQAAT